MEDQSLNLTIKIDDLNSALIQQRNKLSLGDQRTQTVEAMLKAAYNECNQQNSTIRSLELEKKRLVDELKKFVKRPLSNLVESELIKKKAMCEVYHSTTNEVAELFKVKTRQQIS
jgi:midasin (ATPase involved in ribosome maturation)